MFNLNLFAIGLAGIFCLISGLFIGIHITKSRTKKSSEKDKARPQKETASPILRMDTYTKTEPSNAAFFELLTVHMKTAGKEKAFQEAFERACESVSFEDALKTAKKLGYTTEDAITIMKKQNCSPAEMGTILLYTYESSLRRILEIVFSDSANSDDVIKFLSATKDFFDFSRSIGLLVDHFKKFFTTNLTISILHKGFRGTIGLYSIVKCACGTDVLQSPLFELADLNHINLTDNQEYFDIRSSLSFSETARLLKQYDSDVLDVLNAEETFTGGIGDVGIPNAIKTLIDAGYEKEEILEAVWNSDITIQYSIGETLSLFLGLGYSFDDVFPILKKEKIEAKTFFDELHGFVPKVFDFEELIRIVYKYIEKKSEHEAV